MPKTIHIDFADTVRYYNHWTPQEIKELVDKGEILPDTYSAYLNGEDWAEEEVAETLIQWVRENDMFHDHIKDDAPLIEYK